MRGDRFKARLPKFVGKIPDMHDLFQAEDREFEKIDILLFDFINALSVEGIKNIKSPEYFLIRLEKEYGLDNVGNTEERIAKIITKIRGAKTTTIAAVIEICNVFGYDVSFIPRYEEYGFTLDFKGAVRFNGKVLESIEVVKPAHLEYDIRFIFNESLSYKEKTDVYKPKYWMVNEPPCGRVPNQAYKGKKFSDVIKVSNGSNIRNNRQVKVNEIKAGGVVNK